MFEDAPIFGRRSFDSWSMFSLCVCSVKIGLLFQHQIYRYLRFPIHIVYALFIPLSTIDIRGLVRAIVCLLLIVFALKYRYFKRFELFNFENHTL